MSESSDERISRYIMHAFGRSTQSARIPRRKPDGMRTVATARIVLSVQYGGRFTFMPLAPVDIRADSAEWYGYKDGIPYSMAPSMLSDETLMEAGRLIERAAAHLGRRITLIASGDLSHRLQGARLHGNAHLRP